MFLYYIKFLGGANSIFKAIRVCPPVGWMLRCSRIVFLDHKAGKWSFSGQSQG